MVLLAGGIEKTRRAAHLFVLLRNAAEKTGIANVGRVSVGARAEDSKIENRLDLTTDNAQVFKT
jgi:hypothetical protein